MYTMLNVSYVGLINGRLKNRFYKLKFYQKFIPYVLAIYRVLFLAVNVYIITTCYNLIIII